MITWLDLPVEIWCLILNRLGGSDLAEMQLVHPYFRSLIENTRHLRLRMQWTAVDVISSNIYRQIEECYQSLPAAEMEETFGLLMSTAQNISDMARNRLDRIEHHPTYYGLVDRLKTQCMIAYNSLSGRIARLNLTLQLEWIALHEYVGTFDFYLRMAVQECENMFPMEVPARPFSVRSKSVPELMKPLYAIIDDPISLNKAS